MNLNRHTTPAAAANVWLRLPQPLAGGWFVAAAVASTIAATLAGLVLSLWLPQQSTALVYLLSVMLAALTFGMATGLSAAILSFLADNYFFIEPRYSFTIADRQELFALFVFLVVALLTGSLAGRMRETAHAAIRRSAALQVLNEFAAELSGSRDQSAILTALADRAASTIAGAAVVLVPDDGKLVVKASTPGATTLETAELQTASRVFRSGTTVHAVAPGWPGPAQEFRALVGSRSTIGVVGLAPNNGKRTLDSDQAATIDTLLRHAAIAIERTQSEADTARARDEAERERLRAALLSSLSHDLRTPLASILGAATSLRELGPAMTAEMRADLLLAIEEEAQRLSRFVSNLLDMTRLQAGSIDITHDWVEFADATQVAIARARQLFPAARITLSTDLSDVPAIRGDATLIEHVVFNLLDNAVKFSPDGSPIVVTLTADQERLKLSITDKGQGIARAALPHVFEPFFRAPDATQPGTGLGLSICKRIVDAMSGTIEVASPVVDGRGTRLTIALPKFIEPARVKEPSA